MKSLMMQRSSLERLRGGQGSDLDVRIAAVTKKAIDGLYATVESPKPRQRA